MESWFEMPDLVMLVAERSDGQLVGYSDLLDHGAEHLRFPIDVRVPRGEAAAEVADALLAAMEARAAKKALEGATVRLGLPSTDELCAGVAESRGYETFRHSFQMRIELGEALPAPELPAGIAVRTFVPGQDDEAVFEAHQDSFADAFEATRWPYDNWRQWAFPESFDPSLWFVAEGDGEIAGVCLCRAEGHAGPEFGWVNVLGVLPRFRRRGLGRAFLLHTFAEFRARGKRGVGLGVDGLNPTGAVRLYERAGMYVARRYDQYKKPLAV
jgi:mycothiol synthase